eukprot:TRINITY_DN1482_c0_g1_i1.p1 TRINITY_DN1482_c0_g1~~TRINITY_DN1482_c0_g1_i1.p1  ORF type:complete len:303 (-),score=82.28 TRINITY_DN1482_c0_g1_i1:88-954(-)
MAPPLKGQVAIITGASRGIGRQVALTFAQAGINVVVAAKSTEDKSNLPGTIYSVAEEVRKFGVEALPIKCDVRQEADIVAMVEATIQKFGRVDILVNNAGALWWKKMVDTPMKRYDLINDVNARATFCASKTVLPYMLKQGHGHIINMSPPVDLSMLSGKIGYCISKFGMTLVAHGLGQEVKGTGVACNALWPATMIESFATINFQMGERSLWRKAEILADCCLMIVKENANEFTGHALIDEDYMRSRNITDFVKYRCDPSVEPPRITTEVWGSGFERGHVQEVKSKL